MESRAYFTGSQLKWLAIISMLMDHTAKIISFHLYISSSVPYTTDSSIMAETTKVLFPIFIMIGRLAFPLFCFLLVQGFIHTSNVTRYGLRLLLFAFLSEIPYDLAFSKQWFDWQSQNVFFTLLIGLLVIAGLRRCQSRSIKGYLISGILIICGIFSAEWLHTDYGGWIGVLLIVVLYIFRNHKLLKCLFGGAVILQNSLFGIMAFPLIYFYNGQRGRQMKYFFYWFYPVHLLVLTAIQQFIIVPYFLTGF
ncbi:TraX family protein [Enterococcus wangshanyuanii]|uniref:Fimbrial assembly protein fimC n=1 Tax=Enterococcus wangshanyuanii TaxID=2005703 RepID=A0ABQ1NIR6_9ENTE|nr:TraX family protein [Enterococcus wangshanyuanii]GGC78261.1 fimbrial assembly protein fimC [Enterococcus wangshanyuanii]